MGMNPADFWPLSFRDWMLKQRGFFELRNQDYKTSWEQARMISYYSIIGFAKKGKIKRPQDLFKFDWEKQAVTYPTRDEMDYWVKKMGRYVDNQGRFFNA